eukprot:10812377-Lingulodinium_polyedra.AAC.1
MTNIKGLYQWGKHYYYDVRLCGVRYRQGHDWSVAMDQREYVETLAPHDLQPRHDFKQAKDRSRYQPTLGQAVSRSQRCSPVVV